MTKEYSVEKIVEVVLEDILANPEKLHRATKVNEAYHGSDKDDQGHSLLGSDAVIGAMTFAQCYRALTIGLGADESIQERVYDPLDIVLAAGSNNLDVYKKLGRTVIEHQF